jgi:hypothetical protein
MLRILIYRVSVAKRMVCARHFAAAACGRQGELERDGRVRSARPGFRRAARAAAVPLDQQQHLLIAARHSHTAPVGLVSLAQRALRSAEQFVCFHHGKNQHPGKGQENTVEKRQPIEREQALLGGDAQYRDLLMLGAGDRETPNTVGVGDGLAAEA